MQRSPLLSKWLWLLIAVLALGMACAYWVQVSDGTPANVVADAGSVSRATPEKMQVAQVDTPLVAGATGERMAPEHKTSARYSAQALLVQRNLRAADEEALRHPELGGVYHAQALRRLCFDTIGAEQNAEAIPSNAPHDLASRQQAALDDLRQRCAGYSSEELNGKAIHDLALDRRAQDDPLMRLQARWAARASLNPAERDALRADMLATRDPLFLDEWGPELSHQEVDGSERYYLDGQAYTGAQGEIFNAAWRSAICEGGAGCGDADVLLVGLCALHGFCEATRQQAVMQGIRQAYGAAGAALFQQLVVRLQQVIATADANALRVAKP
ncbi:hypothetical protein [Paracidovorax wautersii]|uniref:hypothetical protein n=1 Tax=Paracidovorax wautersii TaxID=1177982 RepID=UPI0031CE5A85